jgi:hypothetical protein
MPTARELLEQADALMRRNRAPGQESDIPELTDEIAIAATGAPSRAMMASRSTPQKRHSRDDDVPELNDAVEELSLHPIADDGGEVSRWLEADLGEPSITGPAPDSIAVVPPSTLRTPSPKVEAPLNAAPESLVPIAPTPAATLVAHVTGTLSSVPAELPPVSDPGFEAMLGAAPATAAFEEELSPVASAPSPVAPPSAHGEATAPLPIAETAPPPVTP